MRGRQRPLDPAGKAFPISPFGKTEAAPESQSPSAPAGAHPGRGGCPDQPFLWNAAVWTPGLFPKVPSRAVTLG